MMAVSSMYILNNVIIVNACFLYTISSLNELQLYYVSINIIKMPTYKIVNNWYNKIYEIQCTVHFQVS